VEYNGTMSLKRFFLYITNNEETSRHEEYFDIGFFIVNTVASILGIVIFIAYNEPQWIPLLIIEYTWALDNMRHNRE
jgi:fluoride ion exporter CrcB/FEX